MARMWELSPDDIKKMMLNQTFRGTGSVERIYLQCPKCIRRIQIVRNCNAPEISDKAAKKYFLKHGWALNPTRCPWHKND